VQREKDRNITLIKLTWKINDINDAFPPAIRPSKSLGTTAIANIRIIARQVPNLAAAQALFLGECKDSSGQPVPVSWNHTSKISKALKSAPGASSTPTAGTTMNAANSSTGKEKVKPESKPKRAKTAVPQEVSPCPNAIWAI